MASVSPIGCNIFFGITQVKPLTLCSDMSSTFKHLTDLPPYLILILQQVTVQDGHGQLPKQHSNLVKMELEECENITSCHQPESYREL